MKNNRCGQIKGRGDPRRTSGSRGDPPAVCEARGDPPWMFASRGDPPLIYQARGDPPELFGSRGHPPEIRNARDGPPLANGTRGKPPEMKTRRYNSFKEELVFRILAGQNPEYSGHGRGMPGREGCIGCPLPEGNGKGYCPDRIDCTVQKHYSLPFALANGHKRKRHNGRFEKVVQGFIAVSDGMERMD